MSKQRNGTEEVNAVLHDIVIGKLREKTPLSRDEKWFYLTRILRVSQEEAERIMERLKADSERELSGQEQGSSR